MPERVLTKPEIEANVAKTLAEAALATAAVEEKLAATREHDANASARKREEEATRLLLKHSGIENRIAEIALAKVEREEDFARVSDLFHHAYNLDEKIDEKSVKAAINTLTAWHRQDPNCDITIYINSPGGSIIDGLALIDFLLELRREGHKITTIALGIAASMAGVVLQSGDVRVMGANAILLIHEGSLGAIGSFAEVEDRVALMHLFHERILDLFEDRAKPINAKTNKNFIKKNWSRRDWWLDSSTAKTLGFCDEIR